MVSTSVVTVCRFDACWCACFVSHPFISEQQHWLPAPSRQQSSSAAIASYSFHRRKVKNATIWIYLNPPCPLLSAFTPKSPNPSNPTIHSILYILWHPLPLRYGFYLHVHGHPAAVIYQVRVASLNEGGIHSFVVLDPLALYHRLAARATKKNLVGFQTTNYRFNSV